MVTLTDEQFGAMFRALSLIACGRQLNRLGNHQRLSRDRMQQIAREAAIVLNVRFDQKAVDDTCGRIP